jgi:hydrogenase maturation protease
MQNILLIGVGNPYRMDDGVGVLFIEFCKKHIQDHPDIQNMLKIDLFTRYQLTIDEIEPVLHFEKIFIIDATKDMQVEHFCSERVKPAITGNFTTHLLSPSELLLFVNQLFGRYPEMDVISIRGYQWDYGEGLSAHTEINLSLAFEYFKNIIGLKSF